MEREESVLITPEEIEAGVTGKPRERKPKVTKTLVSTYEPDESEGYEEDIVHEPILDEIIQPAQITPLKEAPAKHHNRAGMVGIGFESMGRFDIPKKMYFNDWDTQAVHDLTLSRQEDLMENLVAILDRLKNEDAVVSVGDATVEEFFEILIGMKECFIGQWHTHPWVCTCQMGIPDKEQIINEMELDLSDLHRVTIEEAENDLKEFYREALSELSSDDLRGYLLSKYGDEADIAGFDLETEIETIAIHEPYNVPVREDEYQIRFMRIRDLIEAGKHIRRKYEGQISQIQKQQFHGRPLAEVKAEKADKIERLREQEAKDIILCAKALTIVSINGKELSTDEKMIAYKAIPRSVMEDMADFLDKIKFGINDKREYQCPICGDSDERLLQQEFDPLELLPFDSSTDRKSSKPSGLNIHFGV